MPKHMSPERHETYVSRRKAERERTIVRRGQRASKWFAAREAYLAMGGAK